MSHADYIASEPDPVNAWADQLGNLHASRDDAIDANFQMDLRAAITGVLLDHPRFSEFPVLQAQPFLIAMIAAHPEMIRVMLGDRDPT